MTTKSETPACHRANRSRFSIGLGRNLLKALGWKVSGDIPDERKMIIVAAPHTSNWDFVIAMSVMLALDLKVNWLGKHTLFRSPYGNFMRWLGGIPVLRENPEGIAENIGDQIRQSEAIIIGITPEGTRKKVEHWKTGSLRIAQAARCKILLVAWDYPNKAIVIGDLIDAEEDVETQILEIKDYFRQFGARHPERF